MLTIPSGYDFLGSTQLVSAAQTTASVAIDLRDILLIQVRVTGYSGGGDIASLRFNGDTGANYRTQFVTFTNATPPVGAGAALAGTVASATLARMFAATSTLQRTQAVFVTNNQATSKVIRFDGYTGTGSAVTQGVIELGGGEWVNTTAQINSVVMLTAGGSVTLSAGSGFAVFGRNL